MAGVVIEVSPDGLSQIPDALARMGAEAARELPEILAGVLENQTRARFGTKESPDGTPWAAWSEPYARTRHSGHSLLESEGFLHDSIYGERAGDAAVVGSPFVQAAVHQFGSAEGGIPARPYLGISKANGAELQEIVLDWLDNWMGAAQ